MRDYVDFNMLTMEQYLALIHDNIRPGIVKPKIGDDIEFKINGNFMRELRRKLSKETIIKYCDESNKNQAVNDEWIKKFIENTDLNLRALDTTIKNLHVKADQLTQTILTNAGERVKAEMKMGKKDMKESVPRDLPVVQPYVPPKLFP
uniref:Uncharacterized protein n=1 Tax=Tanacetum cinerariifolium TaxID=118510 RepID=A0A6L2LYQ7_TANCI|nr:hypothetical protein [Tanacetum cinerariifolium]